MPAETYNVYGLKSDSLPVATAITGHDITVF
jgi:hypothetical protein